MRLKNEIQRAVKHINANAPIKTKIDDAQIESYVIQTIANLKSGNYDFSTYDSIVLKQGTKKRHVKLYKPFSTENILCQYIKQILDRQFKIKYPNRNKAVHTLFDFLKAVKQMSEFTIIKFDFIWVTDISYIGTDEGWLYLATVKDLFDRQIVGFATGNLINTERCKRALCSAIQRYKPGFGLIHHSDRGVQYASKDYQNLLKQSHIICSMSRSGVPYDNACAETFFSTIKLEMIYH